MPKPRLSAASVGKIHSEARKGALPIVFFSTSACLCRFPASDVDGVIVFVKRNRRADGFYEILDGGGELHIYHWDGRWLGDKGAPQAYQGGVQGCTPKCLIKFVGKNITCKTAFVYRDPTV